MGLLGMMARTAVVAGTATAVSGRVARRQQNRWQQKADAQAYQEEQTAPQNEQQPQYQQAPQQPPPQQYQQPPYQQPQYQQPPEAAPAADASDNLVGEIQRLAALKEQGVLTDDEFTAAKSKLLGI